MSKRGSTWVLGLVLAVMAVVSLGATATAGPPASDPTLALERVLGGFTWPTYAVSDGHPDRLFINEGPGRIKALKRVEGTWRRNGVFLDLRDRIKDPRISLYEQGLLGLAFHPDYATNGRFYVFYSRESGDEDRDGDLVLAEFQRSSTSPFRADPATRRVLFVIQSPYGFHNGGWLAFGPDGYLYLGVGDGGAFDDPHRYGQDREVLLAKLLRLDPLDPDGAGPARYTVPADNPYVGGPGHDLIWSYGLRNPWRASFDRLTGDLWIGDPGQAHFEEVDHVGGPHPGKGLNFGWRKCEGAHRFTGGPNPPPCDRPGLTMPVIELNHDVPPHRFPSCAVIGGYVYRGTAQPGLQGRYLFADHCNGFIWDVPTDFDAPRHRFLPDPLVTPLDSISSFGEDAEGEVYVMTLEGDLFRIVED